MKYFVLWYLLLQATKWYLFHIFITDDNLKYYILLVNANAKSHWKIHFPSSIFRM